MRSVEAISVLNTSPTNNEFSAPRDVPSFSRLRNGIVDGAEVNIVACEDLQHVWEFDGWRGRETDRVNVGCKWHKRDVLINPNHLGWSLPDICVGVIPHKRISEGLVVPTALAGLYGNARLLVESELFRTFLYLCSKECELLFCGDLSRFSIDSRLLRGGIQKIALDCHFLELPIENNYRNEDSQESDDCEVESSLRIAKSAFFKRTQFDVFNYTYGKRFIHNPYGLWFAIVVCIAAAWVGGACGVGILLDYGRWNERVSRWFERCRGRSFTDGERVALGVCGFVVSVALLFQAFIIVSQKYLDPRLFSYYTKYMANVLSTNKQIEIVGALCEGSSIRSIERITGVHRDTIMRLGVKVGKSCTALMDAKMRNLDCHRLEMDEIWGYVGKKEKHVRPGDNPQFGNVWTFCAIDADTKLVPAFQVSGDRGVKEATAFVVDVADRMNNRVRISTDGLAAYVEAIVWAFGRNVDYGQIIKVYGTEESVEAQRRYSAPKITSSEKKAVFGRPDFDLISTSYVERLNATTRLHMKRLARLTYAFSKKRENFEAAVGLHFAYYNFVKRHNTLRCTPAMAAGVEPPSGA